MTTATETALLCSKCGSNPRANGKESTNPWCKDCLAKYQKEYKEMLVKRNSEQAFARGVAAMRKLLMVEFERLGSGAFTGYEISVMIGNVDRPTSPDPVMV